MSAIDRTASISWISCLAEKHASSWQWEKQATRENDRSRCLHKKIVIVTGFECLATFSAMLPELVSNVFKSGFR